METGTHDPRDTPGWVCVEGHAACVAHTSVARRRTEADVMALRGEVPSGWVRLPEGGIVPAKLARATGWTFDEDRDSTLAAKLSGLVRHMDEAVSAWVNDNSTYPDPGDLVAVLVDLTDTWVSIRAITQGRDITQTGGQQ